MTDILSKIDQTYYFIGTMNQSLRVEGIETNETTGEKFKLTYDIEADLKNPKYGDEQKETSKVAI